MFIKYFPIVDTCLTCEDIAGQSCPMVRRWRFFASFLRPVFPASRMQHISDLHSKFAPRLQRVVYMRMVYIQSLRLGEEKTRKKKKKKKKKKVTTAAKYNVRICCGGRP